MVAILKYIYKVNIMAKPTNDTTDIINAIPTFDTSKWTEEQVGFAPYWSPVKGASFIARVMQKDIDPEAKQFTRYLMQAGEDLACKRGPADGAEDVTVKKGEYFTISVYFSLQGLFDFYLESGHKPWMKVNALEERKTSTPGQTVWTWKLLVSPEDKKKADVLRAARPQMLSPKKDETPAELSS